MTPNKNSYQTKCTAIISELDRNDKLILFINKNPSMLKEVAHIVGVSAQSVRNWLNRGVAPTRRVSQLRKTGLIPDDLLPDAEDRTPGPKPKTKEQVGIPSSAALERLPSAGST